MISFWRPLTALLCLYAVQTTEADTEGLSPICLLKFGEVGGYIKFFPDIMLFAVKAAVVLIGLYFLLGALLWIFGASIALHINGQLLGI